MRLSMRRTVRAFGLVLAVAITFGPATIAASPVAAVVASKAWTKPCSVVAKSDVEKAVGVTIARMKSNAGPVKACLYYEKSASAPLGIWLNDKPLTGTAAREFAFDAKQAKKNSSNKGYRTV